MSRPLTVIFLLLFVTFAVVHALAIEFSLYWFFWWFDVVMHFFGGVFISLGLFVLEEVRVIHSRWLRPLVVAVFAVAVMIAWEIFELLAGIPIIDGFVVDTVTDICVGGLGVWLGYQFGRRFNDSMKYEDI